MWRSGHYVTMRMPVNRTCPAAGAKGESATRILLTAFADEEPLLVRTNTGIRGSARRGHLNDGRRRGISPRRLFLSLTNLSSSFLL